VSIPNIVSINSKVLPEFEVHISISIIEYSYYYGALKHLKKGMELFFVDKYLKELIIFLQYNNNLSDNGSHPPSSTSSILIMFPKLLLFF